MAKKKPINYDTEIKIRISKEKKEELRFIANLYQKSISKYIRDLLEKEL